MKVDNKLVKAMQEGSTSFVLVSAADIKEFALFILEEAKKQNLFAQPIVETQPEEKEEEQQYMTAQEVCKKLKISEPTLWRMGKSGRLIPLMVGGRRRYLANAVEALLS